jgi:hypothetical protein
MAPPRKRWGFLFCNPLPTGVAASAGGYLLPALKNVEAPPTHKKGPTTGPSSLLPPLPLERGLGAVSASGAMRRISPLPTGEGLGAVSASGVKGLGEGPPTKKAPQRGPLRFSPLSTKEGARGRVRLRRDEAHLPPPYWGGARGRVRLRRDEAHLPPPWGRGGGGHSTRPPFFTTKPLNPLPFAAQKKLENSADLAQKAFALVNHPQNRPASHLQPTFLLKGPRKHFAKKAPSNNT